MDQKSFTVEELVTGIRTIMARGQQRPMTADTANGCAAFARWFAEDIAPLPVDPVALLLNYELYQSLLASEASKIECLPREELLKLRSGVRCAVVALQDATGGSGIANADAISLMARGIAEHIADVMDRCEVVDR